MPDSQASAIAFLSSPDHHPSGGPVEVVETHGALVFLAGEVALKIKRAVKYDYMDLSTLDLRETMLRRELALNQPAAPMIYRDVVPVVRGPDGGLALGGPGAPVEWVLRMWRFPARDELTAIVARGEMTDRLAEDLGHAVAAYHAAAPVRPADGARLIGDILDEFRRVFADMGDEFGTARRDRVLRHADDALAAVGPLLTARGASGHVRRGHGDLHLRNVVLIGGRPVLFDGLEFDEVLGTCDVLYDLAFLLMDLAHRDLSRAANLVQNTYLLAREGAEDAGMAALPLFIAVRAAIRAMVTVQTDRARGQPGAANAEARRYLDEALAALAPGRARLVAVGGVSGTGKTVLARALSPSLGAVPGAVHLRSDLERKAAAHVAATTHLPPSDYAKAARDRVYARMLARAGTLLAAGRSVVLDATFLDPGFRDRARALAAGAGVPFAGLWLTAPEGVLVERVSARAGDASDADAAVVRGQLARDPGPIDWHVVDAGGDPAAVLAGALRAPGLQEPEVA